MSRPRTFVILLGAAGAVVRHVRGAVTGRRVPGGILIGDAVVYDALSHRLVLGSLFGRIAADVAAVAPAGARVLEGGLRARPLVYPAGSPARARRDRSRPRSGP